MLVADRVFYDRRQEFQLVTFNQRIDCESCGKMNSGSVRILVFLISLLIGCLILAVILLGCLVFELYPTSLDKQSDREVSPLEVIIPQGKLRGVLRQTFLGRNVSAFLGVPYAEPPVGHLRYKPPVPPSAWSGTFEADHKVTACPQYKDDAVVGDEDCLRSNIYTPNLPVQLGDTLLPTIVYFIGGNFMKGIQDSRIYNHHYLLDADVVLVTPAFRLGAIGFFSTGDEVVPGNNGQKDIIRALKWVQENIKYFGGDPNRVTLFGHGSGAACAHLTALSPLSNGLFQRYITSSSPGLARNSYTKSSVLAERAFLLGSRVGCSTNNTRKLVDCLEKVNIKSIITHSNKLLDADKYPLAVWTPTDEPDIEGSFMTERPDIAIARGRIRDLPWIVGVVPQEGIVRTACFYHKKDLWQHVLDNFDTYLSTYLPYFIVYDHRSINVTAYTEDVKAYYFKDLTIDPDLILANLTDAISDGAFFYSAWYALQHQVAFALNPTYFYIFNYRGTFSINYSYCGSRKVVGVAHSDDLVYLFNIFRADQHNFTETFSSVDYDMKRKLVALWTSFATDGVPLTSPETHSTIWKPYDPRENNILRIGDDRSTEISVQHTFYEERLRFWAGMAAKYGC